MLSFAPIRPRLAEWRGWLPAAALPLFMFAALIALGGDRWHFYRWGGLHDFATAKTLTVAENLSPEHQGNRILSISAYLTQSSIIKFDNPPENSAVVG